jgi:hypothetical protein
LFKNSANSTTGFQIQNAAGNNILSVDTTGGIVNLGKASSVTGQIALANSTNANFVTIQSGVTSGAYTIILPTAIGTAGQCLAVASVVGSSQTLGYSGCSGAGGGIGGSGTTNQLAKFTASGTVGDSSITDTGAAVTLASNTDIIMQGATAYITNPQGNPRSEAFGAGATAASTDAVAVGYNSSSFDGSVAVGAGAANNSSSGVAVGVNAQSGFHGTAVGAETDAAQDSVALGSDASATDQRTVAIGRSATIGLNGQDSVVIGYGASTGTNAGGSVVLGSGATSVYANSLVVGGSTASGGYINQGFLGSGVTDVTPQNFVLHVTGGSGTNVAGASLSVAGGIGTGNANGGNVNFQVAKAGVAGAGANSLATVASLSGANGAALFQNSADSTAAFQVQNAAGTISLLTADTTNARLVVGSGTDLESNGGNIDSPYGGIGNYGNLLDCSEFFDAASCVNTDWATSNLTVTANDAASNPAPNATISADKFVSTNTNATISQTSATAPTNANYTFSVWLKTNSGSQPVTLRINGATTGAGTAASYTATTTWQRFSVTQNPNGFTGNLKAVITLTNNAATVVGWGGQLVLGSTPGIYTYVDSLPIVGLVTVGANINGRISTTGPLGGLDLWAQDGSGNLSTVYSSAGELAFYVGQNIRGGITTAGDFGIGLNNSTSPTARLHVTTDQAENIFQLTDTTGGGTANVMTVADEGATTFQNRTNSTSAFRVQNAAGANIVNIDTSGAIVTFGQASTSAGKIAFANATNGNLATLQGGVTTSSYTTTLPTAIGSAGQCLAVTSIAGANQGLGYSSCGTATGVNLQATTPGLVDTGNFNISGTGIAATFLGSDFDRASAGTLTFGNTNATTVNIASNAAGHTVNVGTGAAAQTVNIGSATGGSTTTINGGTGGITQALGVGGSTATTINGNTVFSLNSNGGATFKTVSDDGNAFAIQNAAGANLINLANSFGGAELLNPSFEANPLTDWSYSGVAGGSVARDTTRAYLGTASLKLMTNGGANDGVKQTLYHALTPSTDYRISWEAEEALFSNGPLTAAYSYDGTNQSNCTNMSRTDGSSAGFVRYTCVFTTGSGVTAPTASNAVIFKQATAMTQTWYLDAVMLTLTYGSDNANFRDSTLSVNSTFDQAMLIEPVNASTTAFQVRGAVFNNTVLDVDTINSFVGINTANPLAQLDVQGALRLGGTSQTSYTSPLGTPVNTKINIPNFDPGLYGQLMAMGLPASSDSTARAISVYDGRLSAHYPSIQVVSPNESQVGGFSWEGSNTTFRVKNSSTTIAFNVGGFDAANIRDAGGSDTIMELGVGSSKNGQLSFLNSTNSNFVIMQAGATAAANLFITLPTGVGTTGQCLALASAVSPNETLGYSDCLTTGTGVQLQASTPGTQQTGNINVSGKVVAGTALSSALLDNSGTLGIGTANATTTTIGRSGQTVNFAGDNVNINSGGSMAISGTTTVNNYRLFVGGTLNSATTTSQYGFQNESSFNPAGASLTNLYNNSNVLNVSGSSVNIANAISVHASITTAAGYTGQINDARAISVSAPTISGSQLFPTYTGVYINGSAQNTGNTSGTIVNRGIFLGGNTAAAAGGGTMNNYAMYLTQPAGSGAGTTNNYGIYITGNGGGTSNYSIYNSSTAASYLAGDLRVGTTSNPSGYAVNVQGTMNATTMQATTAVIAESSGPGGTAGIWQAIRVEHRPPTALCKCFRLGPHHRQPHQERDVGAAIPRRGN